MPLSVSSFLHLGYRWDKRFHILHRHLWILGRTYSTQDCEKDSEQLKMISLPVKSLSLEIYYSSSIPVLWHSVYLCPIISWLLISWLCFVPSLFVIPLHCIKWGRSWTPWACVLCPVHKNSSPTQRCGWLTLTWSRPPTSSRLLATMRTWSRSMTTLSNQTVCALQLLPRQLAAYSGTQASTVSSRLK